MKLFILLIAVACSKPDSSFVYIPTTNPKVLVKYNDVIYHCQEIVKTECGHTIHCGNLSYHCTKNLVIENI